MPRTASLAYSAIRSEGALLPGSILGRIHAEDPRLPGMKPADFGLSGMRVREAASRAWNALQGPWHALRAERERLEANDPGTGMTRARWLTHVLRALDYGLVDALRSSLRVGDQEFPVSHLYGHAPLHLVGCGLDLDRRTAGAVGAARMSPHGMVQLLLNASESHLWGVVSNGLRWRLLRDSQSLSRQAMVEFDLEAIFERQLYNEFLLFFLVCHASRLKAERSEECLLEQWFALAGEEGKRALDTLRDGVQAAIEELGQGFLRHPANQPLRDALRDGALSPEDYYRQLLRIVYRLIFLFVAEDRGLLLYTKDDDDPKAGDEARRLYHECFSTRRLRLLAERMRGSARYGDLWLQFQLVAAKLGDPRGCPELGLPFLGGLLFTEGACPQLDAARLANADFLGAVRHLATTTEGGRPARVDFRNLAGEEMGSVYESLLELHPVVEADASAFSLRGAAGSERKTTGSYYTPDSLIQCLLDSALDPVVEEALRRAPQGGREEALLGLRIVDPAVGSGHFLIAAAHRLARRLAQERAGEEEPAPEATRSALRDVIGRCLHGVDINPMAAELCKVALWMEALEPGKPLTFLDHHIVVGNSLIGATPELIEKGVPDGAYEPIEGDDRAVCASLRKQNRQEREGQGVLFSAEGIGGRQLAAAQRGLAEMDDSTPEGVRGKERRHKEVQQALEHRRLIFDAWCAAFFLPKRREGQDLAPHVTTDVLNRLARGEALPQPLRNAIRQAAEEHGFFHPHLAFQDVFERGGFDVVLGNPPWERVKLQEKEWFAQRAPHIAAAPNKAERARQIAKLAESPLHQAFLAARRAAEAASAFARRSGRFALTGLGDVNTYALFAEGMRALLGPSGRAGIIVPTGIATDDTTKRFFGDLMERRGLVALYDFENGLRSEEREEAEEPMPARRAAVSGERLLFPAIDSRTKFCLLTMAGPEAPAERARLAFFCHRVQDLQRPGKVFTLTREEIALLNPNTRTCPVFRTARDAEITKGIYRRVPVLLRQDDPAGNPWGIRFNTMFHMSNDSHLFRTRVEMEAAGGTREGNRWHVPADAEVGGKPIAAGEWLPLYEAKMIHHFDHRWATYEPLERARGKKARGEDAERDVTLEEKRDPAFVVQPRYWVHAAEVERAAASKSGWFLGWRDITNTTNERTAIFAILPRAAVGHTAPLLFCGAVPGLVGVLAANIDAFAFDYATRQKVGGTHLTYGYFHQLPVLPPSAYTGPCPWGGGSLQGFLLPRVLELTYTAHDIAAFARDLGFEGPPFLWDEERRFHLRAELDAAFFHLYGIARDDVEYILETFPIVKRKDLTRHGRYRTKEAILERYDAMATAMAGGVPYASPLAPPPAGGWLPAPAVEQKAEERSAEPPGAPAAVAEAPEPYTLKPPPEPPFPPGKRVRLGEKLGVVRKAERAEGGWLYTIAFEGEERPRRIRFRDR